jgi:hypothetical protein
MEVANANVQVGFGKVVGNAYADKKHKDQE